MQYQPQHYSTQSRAFGSLLAVVLVLLVCWGQLLNATVCPLQVSAPLEILGDAPATETHDCELSGHLLNVHAYDASDVGLPASLALLCLLLWLTGRPLWGRAFTVPITFRRRRHLYFCVFRE